MHAHQISTAAARVIAAALLLLLPPTIGLVTTPVAAADSCPNAAQRAENDSRELPDCRAYEMVTPAYKEGFDFLLRSFSDDGAVAFNSPGNFAGNLNGAANNQYLATRSATGWTTGSLNPPGATYVAAISGGAEALSPDLRTSLWVMYPYAHPNASGLGDFYLRSPEGAFTLVGKEPGLYSGTQPQAVGWSKDLSHVIFNYRLGSVAASALYEFVGTGNYGLPRSVNVDNAGTLTPGETCPKSTSDDGRVIVFASGCDRGLPDGLRLWARVGGSTTVSVSGSECTRTPADVGGACNALSPAHFVRAADDGSRVFLTTDQQLVNGDTDQTGDLYACDIPVGAPAPSGLANSCASLTKISGAGAGAGVESVAAVSADGSRAYFVAQGVLADNLGVRGFPAVAGHHNLYLWVKDAEYPEGHIKFVTQLVANDLQQAQMTPDGRYLVFATASALVTSGPGADTDGNLDVYRYDATTHAVVRISTSANGGGGNDAFDTTAASITADGSLVVFGTAEALAPRDTDGVVDVYAWRDGRVTMISDGGGELSSLTPSGRDIFFTTAQPLTAADGDVSRDIYTARVGGGFDLARQPPCSGDGCRGSSSEAPSLAESRSGPASGGDAVDTAPAVTLRAVSAAQRRRLAATGKVTLAVAANVAGTVRATATATLVGRSTTVASARQTLARAGSTTVALTLSRKARAQLEARGALTVKVTVTHSKVALSRSATLKLTRPRAEKSAIGQSYDKRVAVGGRS